MYENKHRGLWHGKSAESKEWVEGYFAGYFANVPHILRADNGVLEEVISETLGECTGLTDKNKKLIFEGNIIKHYNHKDDLTRFDIGEVFWDEKSARFLRTAKDGNTYFLCDDISYPYEVIGNVHDNPELLQGGETNE